MGNKEVKKCKDCNGSGKINCGFLNTVSCFKCRGTGIRGDARGEMAEFVRRINFILYNELCSVINIDNNCMDENFKCKFEHGCQVYNSIKGKLINMLDWDIYSLKYCGKINKTQWRL